MDLMLGVNTQITQRAIVGKLLPRTLSKSLRGRRGDLFIQAHRYHPAGEHAVAAAAHEKLFDIIWGDTNAQSAFYAQPDFAGYQRLRDLAGQIGDQRRVEVVEEAIAFLRDKAATRGPYSGYGYDWSSSEVELLAQVLLAEGRQSEAYELALAEWKPIAASGR